jgi:hydroxymethylpyrimidine pyrophosphatase-like HAD family hydrolase
MVTIAATGRTRLFAEPILRQLDRGHHSIVANGAQILNVSRNESLRERRLSYSQVLSVVAICQAMDYRLCLEGDAPGTFYTAREQRVRPSLGAFIMDVTHEVASEVHAAVSELPDVHSYISSSWQRDTVVYDVNVGHKEATKGHALEWILRSTSIDRCEVIAIGDGINDLELFATAGYRIATADAHPALLSQADEVIPTQAEDGLAQFLERLVSA